MFLSYVADIMLSKSTITMITCIHLNKKKKKKKKVLVFYSFSSTLFCGSFYLKKREIANFKHAKNDALRHSSIQSISSSLSISFPSFLFLCLFMSFMLFLSFLPSVFHSFFCFFFFSFFPTLQAWLVLSSCRPTSFLANFLLKNVHLTCVTYKNRPSHLFTNHLIVPYRSYFTCILRIIMGHVLAHSMLSFPSFHQLSSY